MLKRLFVLVIFFFFAMHAWADPAATEALVKFLSSYQQASGNFSQTLLDDKGDVLQSSAGTFSLSRPVNGEAVGKFRWETLKPAKQLLIADGQKIYFYDASLQQVTVQKQQAAAMHNSPAMLLSGSLDQISHAYNVEQAQKADQTIFILHPKKDSFFHALKIKFSTEKTLSGMNIEDNLGQKTEIEFNHISDNVNSTAFHFVAPAGTDVVNN